jgi:DNA polymerase-3 subunit beta
LTVQIPAKTSALFRSVCIPWKLLSDIVGAIPGDTIDLDVQHASIRLTSGGFETTIMGMEGDEFPTIPTPNGEPTLRVPATAFTQAVGSVASSAATTMDRPVLTGVRLMVANGKLSLTAADGLRLAKASFDSDATPITSIIHAPALEAVESLFAEESADLGVFVTPNQVFVQSPTATAVMRVIEGRYPDAERIIPTSRKVQFTANRQEMVNAIKLVKLFAASSSHMCRMEIGTDTILLTANAAEMGNQQAIVDATIVGEAFPIAFNASFMERYLKAITGEQVVIESSGPTSPIVLKSPNDDSMVFIIMPMSIR